MIKPLRASFNYHPELDGLRALAMFAIVFFHAKADGWSHAFIALDLFFVLSGFLVAHVVLGEIEESGSFKLSQFYARRVRRLLPAAVLVIFATCVIWLLTSTQPERLEVIRHAQAALVWLSNWQFIAEATDYFGTDINSSPFLHYWSLSIEEQYYILFPLVVLACVKFFPQRRKVLLGVLGVIFVLSLISQIVTAQVDPSRAYFATDARVFQLVAGAILAIAVREFAKSGEGPGDADWPVAGAVLATVGFGGYLVLGSDLIAMSNSNRNITATFLAGAMVVGMFAAPRAWVTRFSSLPSFVYLGKITYSTYLWHWPIVLLLTEYLTVRPSVVAVMALVLATALSSMSYELVERPIRRAPKLNPFGWPVVAVGVAVSVFMATVVVSPVLSSERSPSLLLADSASDRVGEIAAQEELGDRLDRPVPDLDYAAAKRARGPDKRCTPSSPADCVVVDGDGPHVVLVGDSHARTYGDAFARIAEERGFKLSMNVSAGCPFQEGVSVTKTGGVRPKCVEARTGFYDKTLPAMEPDVVVFAAAAQSNPDWHGTIVDAKGRTDNPERILSRATRRTVAKAKGAGAKVLFVKTTMGTEGWGQDGFDPLKCLAKAETQRACAVSQPADRPAEDAIYEALAIEDPDVAVVDTTPAYCPSAPLCVPVLKGEAVWRNSDHLNSTFLEKRSRRLWREVADTGIFG